MDIKKLAIRTQGTGGTDIDDQLPEIMEIADRAVERLADILVAKGASHADVIAFECAVEGRRALEILAVTNQEIRDHGGSPQQAIFDQVAGPESEGMGLTAIAGHLAIGLPIDD